MTIWKVYRPSSGIQPRVGGGGVGQTPAVTICQSWELQSEYISILQSLSILTARTNHIMILMILEESNLSNTFIVMTNLILYLKVPWLDVTDVVLHHTLIQVPLKYICFIFSITKWSNTGTAQGGQ